jgi:osmoprotectant transport system permease protein
VGLISALLLLASPQQAELRVGSKKFPESRTLGEIVARIAEATGEARVVRALNLGPTEIAYQALRSGEIDVYPEYTGTILSAILEPSERADMDAALRSRGLAVSAPLGFNNSYGIGMVESRAEALGIRRISDLARHPALRGALTHEFHERDDGWKSLSRHYGLPPHAIDKMEHALAYEAVAGGKADFLDVYTTDGKIRSLRLRVLEDDRAFFPRYDAVLFYRADLPRRFPLAFARLTELMAGRIPDERMIELNAMVEVDGGTSAEAAARFLEQAYVAEPLAARVGRHTARHLWLVAVSLLAAIFVGLPLGVAASRRRWLGQGILGSTEVAMTVPSLALFAGLVSLGAPIGAVSAMIALFLYSLLPIVRGTLTGLQQIDPRLIESAEALGLGPAERLWRIELPLASRSVMAGIKTSAVINVGTATIAALIGAGGLGDPIVEGLSLRRPSLILEGVVPAVLLALAVRGLFELLEPAVVPRGLRLKRA